MALDIAGIQAALAEDALDGWLLFDFKGSKAEFVLAQSEIKLSAEDQFKI